MIYVHLTRCRQDGAMHGEIPTMCSGVFGAVFIWTAKRFAVWPARRRRLPPQRRQRSTPCLRPPLHVAAAAGLASRLDSPHFLESPPGELGARFLFPYDPPVRQRRMDCEQHKRALANRVRATCVRAATAEVGEVLTVVGSIYSCCITRMLKRCPAEV